MQSATSQTVFPICCFLAAVLLANAAGQNRTGLGKPTEARDRVGAVVFSITDNGGKIIENLQETQFEVFIGGQMPSEVLSFGSAADLPMRIALVIDSSNSMRHSLGAIQEPAERFLRETMRPGSDQALVVAFNGNSDVVQDFTDDPTELEAGIRSIRAGGGTALWDAVYNVCHYKMMHADASRPVRQLMILLSDDEDNMSRLSSEDAIKTAQETGTTIYAIDLGGGQKATDSTRRKLLALKMRGFAEETGGRAFFPLEISDLPRVMTEIETELRNQYVVSYKTQEGTFDRGGRKIQIVPGNKSFHVRVTGSYLLPK